MVELSVVSSSNIPYPIGYKTQMSTKTSLAAVMLALKSFASRATPPSERDRQHPGKVLTARARFPAPKSSRQARKPKFGGGQAHPNKKYRRAFASSHDLLDAAGPKRLVCERQLQNPPLNILNISGRSASIQIVLSARIALCRVAPEAFTKRGNTRSCASNSSHRSTISHAVRTTYSDESPKAPRIMDLNSRTCGWRPITSNAVRRRN